PSMRGDLRRFPPPHVHHGPTPAAYNRKVKELTDESLAYMPELLRHPLIAGQEESFASHRRKRLKLPRRAFQTVPDQPATAPLPYVKGHPFPAAAAAPQPKAPSSQLSLFARLLSAFFMLALVAPAWGLDLSVRKGTQLFQSPSSKATSVAKVSQG